MKPAQELTYDAQADALYLGLATEFAGKVQTIEALGGGILADIVDGKLVAIEVLAASRDVIFHSLIPQLNGATLVTLKLKL